MLDMMLLMIDTKVKVYDDDDDDDDDIKPIHISNYSFTTIIH